MAPSESDSASQPGEGPDPGPTGPDPGGSEPGGSEPGDPGAGDPAPPDLAESLRQVGAAGRASYGAAGDAAKAFRTLLTADVSLARSALGRTLALTGVAIAFGASAWLLLMASLVVWLTRGLGWSWSLALLLSAVLSLAITAVAAWQGIRYFEHTRLQATRRQLARLGIGELADFTPESGSAESARTGAGVDAGANTSAAVAPGALPPGTGPVAGNGAPLKDEQGIDVTPP